METFAIKVDLVHVGEYNVVLHDMLLARPAHILPPFEMAAADALRTLLYDMRCVAANTPDNEGLGNDAVNKTFRIGMGEGAVEGDQP